MEAVAGGYCNVSEGTWILTSQSKGHSLVLVPAKQCLEEVEEEVLTA